MTNFFNKKLKKSLTFKNSFMTDGALFFEMQHNIYYVTFPLNNSKKNPFLNKKSIYFIKQNNNR